MADRHARADKLMNSRRRWPPMKATRCFASDHPKRAWYNRRLALYRREIEQCWRKYERRNRALAHLASNVLLLLCQVHGCSLLSMESLKTLKSTGRGKGVRGRWRNYRNNRLYVGKSGVSCGTNAISLACASTPNSPEEPLILARIVVNPPKHIGPPVSATRQSGGGGGCIVMSVTTMGIGIIAPR